MVKKSIQFTVNNDRVLVPVGEPCPFGCKYCYTRSGEVGPARVSIDEILHQLRIFASEKSFTVIQFGYDGDPFVRSERGITMLKDMAGMGKNISFSTKAMLDEQMLTQLAGISHQMAQSQNVLVGIVSLSCWDSACDVEPYTPSPDQRVTLIKKLKDLAIPTFIAIRPILPGISLTEYEQIARRGLEAGCDGFILGPLYVDAQGRFARFIRKDVLRDVPNREIVVPWSGHAPTWIRYEDEDFVEQIRSFIEQHNGRTFMSSVDAVKFAHQQAFVETLVTEGGGSFDRSRVEISTAS